MRKVLAFILAALMLFSLSAFAFADDEVDTAVAETVSTEDPVIDESMDKGEPTKAELIRFVPTKLVVTSQSVEVHGYFVNLNTDVSVGHFTKFKIEVYDDGDYLLGGSFGTIHDFMIRPLGVKGQIFEFSGGDYGLKHGTLACNDGDYCKTEFSAITEG